MGYMALFSVLLDPPLPIIASVRRGPCCAPEVMPSSFNWGSNQTPPLRVPKPEGVYRQQGSEG